jgi:hypothetical protein
MPSIKRKSKERKKMENLFDTFRDRLCRGTSCSDCPLHNAISCHDIIAPLARYAMEHEWFTQSRFTLSDETREHNGHTLRKIIWSDGTFGGWAESELNISNIDAGTHHFSNPDSMVYGRSFIGENVNIYDEDAPVEIADSTIGGLTKIRSITKGIHIIDSSVENAHIWSSNMQELTIDNVCLQGDSSGSLAVLGSERIENVSIIGGTRLGGGAYVTRDEDYLVVGRLGSRQAFTTFYRDKEKNLRVQCGCFNGTLKEFRARVLEYHGKDSDYGQEYLSAINFARRVFATR